MRYVPFPFQLLYECSNEINTNGDEEDFFGGGRGWRLPGILYADDLVLYGELDEDLKVMVGRFVEVFKRRNLELSADKRQVMC